MNIQKIAIAAILAAAAGSVLAEASYPPAAPAVSNKTRAEVKAELTTVQTAQPDPLRSNLGH